MDNLLSKAPLMEMAKGLREIADFLEANPDMPTPYVAVGVSSWVKEEFLKAAVTLARGGKVEKTTDPAESSWPRYHVTRHFGPIKFDVEIDRKTVCKLVRAAEYECPESLLEAFDEAQKAERAKACTCKGWCECHKEGLPEGETCDCGSEDSNVG